MSLLKEELTDKINGISDNRLLALKPLIDMLYMDALSIENVDFDDLDDGEKEAVIKGRKEYKNGECTDFEDYLKERGIVMSDDVYNA